MKLEEHIFIEKGNNALLSDWGHKRLTLKYKYESEFNNEVKSYKLNKKELDTYLKTGELPKRVVGK